MAVRGAGGLALSPVRLVLRHARVRSLCKRVCAIAALLTLAATATAAEEQDQAVLNAGACDAAMTALQKATETRKGSRVIFMEEKADPRFRGDAVAAVKESGGWASRSFNVSQGGIAEIPSDELLDRLVHQDRSELLTDCPALEAYALKSGMEVTRSLPGRPPDSEAGGAALVTMTMPALDRTGSQAALIGSVGPAGRNMGHVVFLMLLRRKSDGAWAVVDRFVLGIG